LYIKNKKKGKDYLILDDNNEDNDESSENDFKLLKDNKYKIILKKKIRKKLYEKISWKELIENYEIIKIIFGVIHKRNIQFDIEVKNIKNNGISLIRMDNEKLKLIAPTLLCDFYENRLHFS
jgi:hypothetical protein